MTYLLIHSRPSSPRSFFRKFGVLLLIFILVIVFNLPPIKSLTLKIFSPLFGTGSNIQNIFSNYFGAVFKDKISLYNENKNLQAEIESQRLLSLDYEALKSENKTLKEGLGLRPDSSFISSKIIARPPQLPLDSLLINRGTGDFVHTGSFVLASEKITIGKIGGTSLNSAIVILNSSPKVISYGSLERTGESLEIEGIGGGGMRARLPIDFDIKINDKVLVEGSTSFVAAVAVSIEEDAQSGLKEVLFSLPAEISKTKFLFIEPVSWSLPE